MQIQPAVKKETERVAAGTAVGTAVMFLLFFVLHLAMPQTVPFDLKVVVSGILGAAVAVINFFLMGLTVQKVTSLSSDGEAYDQLKLSYRYRMFLQLGWAAVSLVAPIFNGAAGIIPLFFPSVWIKLVNILGLVPQNTEERR